MILIANILLVIFLQVIIGQNLLDPRTLSTMTPLLGVMILVGLAQAFVIGTGGIDLSVPHVVTLMGIIVLKESAGSNDQLPKALAVAALACVLIGLINGFLVEVLGLNALVTTLATGQVVLGVTVAYRGASLNTTRVPEALYSWARDSIVNVSLILVVAVAVVALVLLLVRRIVLGRRLVLASASLRAGELIGIHHLGYRMAAWVLAALIGGVGGVLLAGQIGSPDMSSGAPYLLTSIIVVVLGGAVLTGGRVSPVGTLLGALFIVLLDHGLAVMGFSTGARTLVQGVVLALGLAGVGALTRARPSKSSRDTKTASKPKDSALPRA
ncbi:ABC transporter permease [Microbacterium sp. LRZ72]|uniref:ABC transporter permease n=1 Tax=Microbacterium sp. LRZ72 TaxID=2942481 RepID=UPI0029A4F19E|nr:ABC transporter permease [Microbacterium sp. LRZ72]MDX2378089.1 ABC transporter permease [Microbacterium sp. LRZ72]